MAQAMLLMRPKQVNISTQTGDIFEIFVYLAPTKTLRLYFSESYKDYVICLNFSNCKKYIITRQMWKIFRNYLAHIDNVLGR